MPTPGNTFTDYQGATRTYEADAAGIFVERGQDIVIQNCTITGNGTACSSPRATPSSSCLRTSSFRGITSTATALSAATQEHNIYTECINIIFQYNILGSPRAGALGNNLKDRSAGTVIRYNYIEAGGHMLDLVDPQNSAPLTTQAPGFLQTYVYGNIFVNNDQTPTEFLVHYGGDDGIYQNYRNGTLYFYNNTIVNPVDQSASWRTILFQLDTNSQTVDAPTTSFTTRRSRPARRRATSSFRISMGSAIIT